jgi:hypothetical protein
MPASDRIVARARWPVVVANACDVTDAEGRLLAHARGIDIRGWDLQRIFADAERTREILRFDRPPENIRLQPVRDGIPRTDTVYRVYESATGTLVGVLHRAWPARSLRDCWTLRDADWVECGRMEEASLARALIRTFVTSLPRRYLLRGPGGELGTARRSWDVARVTATLDLGPDSGRAVDRRLLIVLGILLLFN